MNNRDGRQRAAERRVMISRVLMLAVPAFAAATACERARAPVSKGGAQAFPSAASHDRAAALNPSVRSATGSLTMAELGVTEEELLRCSVFQGKGYEVVVTGDGSIQTFREGLRVATMHGDARYCAPSLVTADGQGASKSVGACVSKEDPTRSCIVMNESGGYYLDRKGVRQPLRIIEFQSHHEGHWVEGSCRAALEGTDIVLNATFRVHPKLPSVPEHLSPYFNPSLDREGVESP